LVYESSRVDGAASEACLLASLALFTAAAVLLGHPPRDPSPIFSRKQDLFILISVLAFTLLCFAFVMGHARLAHK
jgi:hypothetical protein